MGRAFEFRKERKMKRWGHMAKTFTKLGKEITIAVKQGGPEVTGNPRLRALIAEAKSEQMPKENIERAIKKATEAKSGDFKEIFYEGFGPFGIAYLVEAATDNNTRTVANVRSYFTKCGGSLQTSGSVAFMFDHKCVFRIKEDPAKPIDLDELRRLHLLRPDPEVHRGERLRTRFRRLRADSERGAQGSHRRPARHLGEAHRPPGGRRGRHQRVHHDEACGGVVPHPRKIVAGAPKARRFFLSIFIRITIFV